MHKVELLCAQQAASWVHDIMEHHICSLDSGCMLADRSQDGVHCTYYIPMLWSVFFLYFLPSLKDVGSVQHGHYK